MIQIKRYGEPVCEEYSHQMREEAEGEWVRFSDLESYVEARVREERDKANRYFAQLEQVFHYYDEHKPGWIEFGKWQEKLDEAIRARGKQ